MNTVKTNEKIDIDKQEVNFAISRMEDTYTNWKVKVNKPHRHNYYTVLIIKKAKGLHKIDFNNYSLDKRQIYFVAPGQVHQIVEKEKSEGYAMIFSCNFLIKNAIPLSFISSLNLFHNYGQSPPLLPDNEQFNRIENFLKQLFSLFHSDTEMKDLSIGAYLKLLLIECNNICEINPVESDIITSIGNLLRTFKIEVDKNYKQEHSTNFYAGQLNISSDHLNRSIKSKTGKTAKEYIQTRIMIEAKRLLCFSDLSNKEIGFELGFNEPANFSAFFKKNTQLSPSKFKKMS